MMITSANQLKLIFVLFFLLGINMSTLMGQNLSDILPKEIGGWSSISDDKLYDSETLFNYINGGAELYISYGFLNMLSRSYEKENHPSITVDIFDMGESKNAFGVFSRTRETLDTSFGQGCLVYDEAIIFWKDKFYVSIIASDDTEDIKGAILSLAKAIDNNILNNGILPDVISHLPQRYLIEKSVMYFHHYIWQNSYYFIAQDNILNINEGSNAVLAKYGISDERFYILLIEYKDSKNAHLAYSNFAEFLFNEKEENIFQIEDGKWIGCEPEKNYLICVFNSLKKDRVESYLTEIKKTIKSN